MTAPIVGASKLAHLDEAIDALDVTLTAEECTFLEEPYQPHTVVGPLSLIAREHFVALTHRNFRLIWLGLLASITGSMMQNAALLWHVSLLVPPERKALALGLVGLVRVVPIVFFSMFSGVVADAWNRRRLMLFTQTGVGARVARPRRARRFAGWRPSGRSMCWRRWRGGRRVRPAGPAGARADARAARASAERDQPEHDHVSGGVGRRSRARRRCSSPPAGVGWVYVANALSFGCVIVALLMMRDVQRAAGPRAARARETMCRCARRSRGCGSCFESPLIRSTMLLDFFATFFSSATALLPIFAQDVLHVGASGYGWLYAAPAVGAVAMSAAMIPLTNRIERRGPVLLWAVAGYGLATVVLRLSRWFWLTFACLAHDRRDRHRSA